MVSRNMVSSWLSRQVSRNGTVVSDESMSYSNLLSDNDDLFAPSALVQSYGSDIVADAWRTVYHRYDEHGHPLYLTRADGHSLYIQPACRGDFHDRSIRKEDILRL